MAFPRSLSSTLHFFQYHHHGSRFYYYYYVDDHPPACHYCPPPWHQHHRHARHRRRHRRRARRRARRRYRCPASDLGWGERGRDPVEQKVVVEVEDHLLVGLILRLQLQLVLVAVFVVLIQLRLRLFLQGFSTSCIDYRNDHKKPLLQLFFFVDFFLPTRKKN